MPAVLPRHPFSIPFPSRRFNSPSRRRGGHYRRKLATPDPRFDVSHAMRRTSLRDYARVLALKNDTLLAFISNNAHAIARNRTVRALERKPYVQRPLCRYLSAGEGEELANAKLYIRGSCVYYLCECKDNYRVLGNVQLPRRCENGECKKYIWSFLAKV